MSEPWGPPDGEGQCALCGGYGSSLWRVGGGEMLCRWCRRHEELKRLLLEIIGGLVELQNPR